MVSGYLPKVPQAMLQIRPSRVVHFAPEQVVHIAPDLLVHFSPEYLVHFTADYSVVIIRPTEQRDQEGWTSAQITVQSDSMGDFDPFLTGIEQSLWNKRAATAAAFAALFQAIGLLIPEPS